MEQRESAVTLFDLDGVLTTQDTMATLITQQLRKKPLRILAVGPIYAVALIAGSHRALSARANRLAVRLTFMGLNDHEYRVLAATAGRQFANRPGFIREDVAELYRTARTTSRVVVVTASEFHLVEALLAACGIHDVELVASRLSFWNRIPHLVLHNVGAEKIRTLHAAGVRIESATFYTDSASDLPVALMTARTIIVRPGKRSRRRLLAALPGAHIIE